MAKHNIVYLQKPDSFTDFKNQKNVLLKRRFKLKITNLRGIIFSENIVDLDASGSKMLSVSLGCGIFV